MTDAPDPALAEISETMVRASRLIKSYRHHSAAPHHGVESALVPLLFQLEDGPRRITELATAVHTDVSTVSRQVSQLTRSGFVAKQPDPADGRALRITLTDDGRESLVQIRRRRQEGFALFLEGWTPAEVADFHSHLERLAAGVERALAASTGTQGSEPGRASCCPG